ncbi:MAG: hypothetical protein ACKPKO_11400, partial [Candidatus Fonsibacter sp.]
MRAAGLSTTASEDFGGAVFKAAEASEGVSTTKSSGKEPTSHGATVTEVEVAPHTHRLGGSSTTGHRQKAGMGKLMDAYCYDSIQCAYYILDNIYYYI